MAGLFQNRSVIAAGVQCDRDWFLYTVILPSVLHDATMWLFKLAAYSDWAKKPPAERLDFIGMMLMGGEL